MDNIVITNNPLVNRKYSKDYQVEFYEDTYLKILEIARDKIHLGHKLLTHPLSSSLKPNETPYKTILITKDKSHLDMNSLRIIGNSIETTKKFLKDKSVLNLDKPALKDFQIIDFDLIESVFNLI